MTADDDRHMVDIGAQINYRPIFAKDSLTRVRSILYKSMLFGKVICMSHECIFLLDFFG